MNKIVVNYESVKPFADVTIDDVTERVPVRVGHANRTTANGPELWVNLEKHSLATRKWLTVHVQPGETLEVKDFKMESGRESNGGTKLVKADQKIMAVMTDEEKQIYLDLIDKVNQKRTELQATKVESAIAKLQAMLND